MTDHHFGHQRFRSKIEEKETGEKIKKERLESQRRKTREVRWCGRRHERRSRTKRKFHSCGKLPRHQGQCVLYFWPHGLYDLS